MVRILFENPGGKCRGKNILLVCVHFSHAGECATALCVIFFLCRNVILPHDFGIDLFIVVERSKI